MARTKAGMEVAIDRRRTKPRFPQGSEVWISGCPKFGAAAKSGLTSPETSRTRLRPRHPPWLSDFALGPHRILAAWLYRRRDQCDAGGGRDGEAVRKALTPALPSATERSTRSARDRETDRLRDEWPPIQFISSRSPSSSPSVTSADRKSRSPIRRPTCLFRWP